MLRQLVTQHQYLGSQESSSPPSCNSVNSQPECCILTSSASSPFSPDKTLFYYYSLPSPDILLAKCLSSVLPSPVTRTSTRIDHSTASLMSQMSNDYKTVSQQSQSFPILTTRRRETTQAATTGHDSTERCNGGIRNTAADPSSCHHYHHHPLYHESDSSSFYTPDYRHHDAPLPSSASSSSASASASSSSFHSSDPVGSPLSVVSPTVSKSQPASRVIIDLDCVGGEFEIYWSFFLFCIFLFCPLIFQCPFRSLYLEHY